MEREIKALVYSTKRESTRFGAIGEFKGLDVHKRILEYKDEGQKSRAATPQIAEGYKLNKKEEQHRTYEDCYYKL